MKTISDLILLSIVAIALETITAEYLLVEVNDAKENGMFYNVFNEKVMRIKIKIRFHMLCFYTCYRYYKFLSWKIHRYMLLTYQFASSPYINTDMDPPQIFVTFPNGHQDEFVLNHYPHGKIKY